MEKTQLIAEQLVNKLKAKNLKISVAESCTGGLVAAAITQVPGSSEVFELSVVTYCDKAKNQLLDVDLETLNKFTAVSQETAEEMAAGIKKVSQADLALSVTGIAGPGGGSPGFPVGLVYFGFAYGNRVWAVKNNFTGNREQVRDQALAAVLKQAIEIMENDC